MIEAAGISTLCVNIMPDYSRAYGFPRVAAIEHPYSLTLGKPGDREGQLQVIRAALQALVDIQEPGGVVHLPFEWPEDPASVHCHPHEPSPIAKLMGQGKISNPVAVLGQHSWSDVDAILGNTRKMSAVAD